MGIDWRESLNTYAPVRLAGQPVGILQTSPDITEKIPTPGFLRSTDAVSGLQDRNAGQYENPLERCMEFPAGSTTGTIGIHLNKTGIFHLIRPGLAYAVRLTPRSMPTNFSSRERKSGAFFTPGADD